MLLPPTKYLFSIEIVISATVIVGGLVRKVKKNPAYVIYEWSPREKIARLELSCTLATMNIMILQTRLKIFQSYVAGKTFFQKQDLQDLEDLIDELKKLRAEVGQYQNC